MNSDCGFDIYPPLAQSPENQACHDKFIQEVLATYGRRLGDDLDSNRCNEPNYSLNDEIENKSWVPHPTIIRINHTDERWFLEFCVGDHPSIPRYCENFLRFSSSMCGRSRAAPHIDTVKEIAEKHFGDRVYGWCEMDDGKVEPVNVHGCYNWNEIHAVWNRIKAVEEMKKGEVDEEAADTSKQANNEPLYEITSVPGKGLGFIAKVDISQGTRIICEKPLFTVLSDQEGTEAAEAAVLSAVRALSRDEQRAFLALHNAAKGPYHHLHNRCSPLLGTCMTNMLPLNTNSEGGLFLKAARINHACLPNARHMWNASLGAGTLHALEDIAQGTEITISYFSGVTMDSVERQRHLREHFGFTCECAALCTLSAKETFQSDMRLFLIQSLTNSDGDDGRSATEKIQKESADALDRLHMLVRALRDEGVRDTRLSGAFFRAAQVAAVVGDKARATAFGQRVYELRRTMCGEDNPWTADAKRLAERPVEHKLYGTGLSCGSSSWEPPRGLNRDEFEAWLWDTDGW